MKHQRAYLVGIKGVAMTALAVYLKEKGYIVSGSDVPATFHTDAILSSNGIPVVAGFQSRNIPYGCSLVVVSGAHGGMTNVETQEAKRRRIPTYMHGQFLGMCMKEYQGISIAGCHGKTTVSALTAWILSHRGLDPSYTVGTAEILGMGPAGHAGKGNYFIAEADEYVTCPQTDKTPRFLWQHPHILVITNIDFDHPDVYDNIQDVKTAYKKLIENVQGGGTIILCADDPNTMDIQTGMKKHRITYGFSPDSDVRITRVTFEEGKSTMYLAMKDKTYGPLTLRIPGKHNLSNAVASMIVGSIVGISWEDMKESVSAFRGTKRRFEKIGDVHQILFYDDYAHHPKEIQATLEGAAMWFPKRRRIAIFQPHTFSRTKQLLDDFAQSFKKVDAVLFADIYPSAREYSDTSISSSILTQKTNEVSGNAMYTPDKKSAVSWLQNYCRQGDLILTMGAGDIYTWHPGIIEALKKNSN